MNQQKIGKFLKELRKEKRITQEQAAQALGVAGRTISRWETGNNMPDLSLMLELSNYYEVEVIEILNGERKSEKMHDELKDTLEKVADYSDSICLEAMIKGMCFTSLTITTISVVSWFMNVPGNWVQVVFEMFCGVTFLQLAKHRRSKMEMWVGVLFIICALLSVLSCIIGYVKG